MTFSSFLRSAVSAGASDLHLVGDERPMMRIQGELSPIAEEVLLPKDVIAMIEGLLSPAQQATFAEQKDVDFGYEDEQIRVRMNVHSQHGKPGISARLIPGVVPSMDDLHLEPALRDTVNLSNGLVLVVGPTGHGKSTTIASLVEEINKTRKAHIVTIEDPIEFVFEDKQSLVEQREIGEDTPSFASALKHVLRQDPDVIVVGEMRDPETIATVLTAAETGHVVFSTLHTSSAAEAIERIVDVFEGAKQKQVLIQLSAVLRVVVAQELVLTPEGTRVAAREILINTAAVANLIRENTISQIPSILQTNVKEGMVSMARAKEALGLPHIVTDPKKIA